MLTSKYRVAGIVSLTFLIYLACQGCSSVEAPVQRHELGKTGIMSIYSPALCHYDDHAEKLTQFFIEAQPDAEILSEFTQRIEPLLGKSLVQVTPPQLNAAYAVSNREYWALSRDYFIDSLIILYTYPGEVHRKWSVKRFDWTWSFSFHATARIVDLAKGKVVWERVAEAPFDVIGPTPPATTIDDACRSQATYLADRLVTDLSKGLFQDDLPQG